MLGAVDMASDFGTPDVKKTLSARVRLSTHRKLGNILELWRELARMHGRTKEEVEALDTTFVVDRLLGSACDAELAQFGGYSESPEAREAQLKALRQAGKKTLK